MGTTVVPPCVGLLASAGYCDQLTPSTDTALGFRVFKPTVAQAIGSCLMSGIFIIWRRSVYRAAFRSGHVNSSSQTESSIVAAASSVGKVRPLLKTSRKNS
ncbi:hypothetical protein BaRGS_00034202 [Batillaria attramentaria]|uniref:Uncharacterized protein n=1 Tax=Batillaria attramentaria TaxID=370345 RepID=A0ABD0JJE1_9CAEN